MREIKFRAIHKLTLKKWNEEDLYFHDGNWYEDFRALEDGRPLNLEQCEVMQYTGLKDENGTEIYEGDIFALEVPYIDFVIGETIYEKEYIPVTYESGSYVLYEQGIQEHNLHDVLTGWRIKEGYKCSGVVVGNIHEHKHLLEAE